MIKKILFFFMLLNTCLVVSQTFNDNGINYTVTDAVNFYVKVGSNPSFTGAASIPESVSYNSQNYTVNELDYGAFSNCSGLTSVTIPSSITSISSEAFKNSPNLTSVSIPGSVTSIGLRAFYGCTGLTSLTLPSSVTMIDDYAFTSCTSLTTLTIPSSVVFIGYLSFTGCTGLTSLTVGCSSIGSYSFYQCTGLTTVTILSSVNTIGTYAFSNCSSLTTVNCYITTPLVIDSNRFQDVNITTCTLNVPAGTEAAYEAAPIWTDFNPINGNLLGTNSFVKANVSLYPNPAKNELFIEVGHVSNTKLEVLDLNGKTVVNQSLNANNTIDTSTLTNGIYIFTVTSNEGSVSTKVIKK